MPTSDENLRLGLLALERGLIDQQQFISVCTAWARSQRGSFAELLVERGWLSMRERAELELLVQREHNDETPTNTLQRPPDPISGLDLDLDLDLGLSETGPLRMRERLQLRGLHSSGGIGEVWRAYDEVLGREVALKRLKQDQAEFGDNRARFRREARITGQLEHPGVVPVYDFGPDDHDGPSFYTMRFLTGRTLSEVIGEFHQRRRADGDDLVTGEFLQLLNHFTSICNTMAFAHARGIVHRDLKGDNIMIGDYGEVIVLDWGLAKRLSTAEAEPSSSGSFPVVGADGVISTMQGERLGTPAFMAPEQALGFVQQIDERTDVYGLSAILYSILCGRPPFQGDDINAVMREVVEQPPPPPSAFVPDVPTELERVCLRGLAKSAAERWPSVAELGGAVRHWLTNLAERRRTEQERERFFDLSLDLLAIVDRHHHLRQSNAAWANLLGWELEQRQDRSLLEFVDPQQRDHVEAKLAELWAGAERVEFEIRVLRRDGGPPLWIDVVARALPHEASVYLVGRDVTARRQSEQQFVGLLESAPDATLVIDASGHIVLVNAQLERMFGYPREQLLGETIEVLVPEPLRERHAEHVRRFVAHPNVRPMGSGMALTAQHADGSIFTVEVSLSPVETETRRLVSCALRKPRAETSIDGRQG